MAGQTFMVGGLDDLAAGDDEDLVPLNEDGDDTVSASDADDTVEADDDEDLFDDEPQQLRSDDQLADDIDEVEGEEGESRDPGKKRSRDREDETPEEKRERRKAERQRKKERRTAARESDRRLIDQQARQIAETNARLYELENRAGKADMARLDQAIETAGQNKQIALQRQEQAREDGDLEAAAQAQEEWADFRDQERQLKQHKENLTKGGGQPQAKVDDAVRRNAEAFMEENKSWYTVGGTDQDSMILDALDGAVANDGFDPAKEEYWVELRSRAAKMLPDRFPKSGRRDVIDVNDDEEDDEEGDDPPPAARPKNNRGRRSPNAGGGGDDRGTGSGSDDLNGIPREYIRELQNLGMWDDKEKRKEMIQRYRDSAGRATG